MLSIYSENNSLNTDKTIEIDNSNQRWWYDTLPTKPMDLHSAIQYDYHNEPHLYLSSWIVIKTTSLSNDNHHTFARKIYLNSMKSRTWMHVLPLTVGWMRERETTDEEERVKCSIDHRHLVTSTLSFGSNSILYWFSNDAVNGRCALVQQTHSVTLQFQCNYLN